MTSIKPLLRFIAKFFGIYIVLVLLVHFTQFDKVYRDLYVVPSSMVAKYTYKNAQVTCEGIDNGKSGDDVVFTFANKSQIEQAKSEARKTGRVTTSISGFKWSFNSYRVDLMFVLYLMALILAYPSNMKRKVVGFLIAFSSYYFLSFILLRFRLLYQIAQNQKVFPEYDISSFEGQLYSTVTNMHTEAMFVFVFVIWGLSMLRKSDFEKIGWR